MGHLIWFDDYLPRVVGQQPNGRSRRRLLLGTSPRAKVWSGRPS
jgi:hypothetical protein